MQLDTYWVLLDIMKARDSLLGGDGDEGPSANEGGSLPGGDEGPSANEGGSLSGGNEWYISSIQ